MGKEIIDEKNIFICATAMLFCNGYLYCCELGCGELAVTFALVAFTFATFRLAAVTVVSFYLALMLPQLLARNQSSRRQRARRCYI